MVLTNQFYLTAKNLKFQPKWIDNRNLCARMLLRFNSEDLFSLKVKDIQPPSAKFLPIGTRVCAHWSPQYRCFYPGTVTEGRFLMPSCNFFFKGSRYQHSRLVSCILCGLRALFPRQVWLSSHADFIGLCYAFLRGMPRCDPKSSFRLLIFPCIFK